MTEETRGRKPKLINNVIDSEIIKFKNEIILDKNSKYYNYFKIV